MSLPRPSSTGGSLPPAVCCGLDARVYCRGRPHLAARVVVGAAAISDHGDEGEKAEERGELMGATMGCIARVIDVLVVVLRMRLCW